MALSTKTRGLLWTPEEDAVILACWQEWSGVCGMAKKGFYSHLLKLLPHRTRSAIQTRAGKLVESGKAPSRTQRALYTRPRLTDTERAYLGALIDGEGSIGDPLDDNGRIVRPHAVRVILVANNNEGILSRVRALIPQAKQYKTMAAKKDKRGVPNHYCVYSIYVGGSRPVHDILEELRPFIFHTDKRRRADRLYAYLHTKLRANGT